jgi:L-ascorbate peroxidase
LLTCSKVVGRSDSTTAAPEGTLPFSFGPGSDYNSLITLWAEKGINPRELAALMGAHSVSRAFTRQENGIPSGGNYTLPHNLDVGNLTYDHSGPQDRTPRSLDVSYYSVTQAKKAPSGVYRFDLDVNLANSSTTCGEAFTEFANDKGKSWTSLMCGD